MARTGRRPGQTETREHILAAARNQFGQRGYDGTTIRGIAAEAGVNPALIHHFFGTKEQVFAAALQLPVDPTVVLATITEGPRGEIAQRILRLFLSLWREPETRQSFLALVRSVSTNEQAAGTLRQFLEQVMLTRVADALGISRLRLTGVMSQVMGIAMVRYIIRAEPLASAEEDELVALVAPVIQHYIDG
ncbi:MAG TPA: TetR family transcriptional regulator [Actinophytocola sp.]|uniref:TetR/AcrR family transcriptional regulator n=1 Tax=Actinophytocola sp. TaxID=1872138 RepID=UPI002DDD0190|nr:TetR family transcriptional regulator [Actinophytocola sp.]HEV2784007.1 TetR family transcriptional regulator [Actinophytocola sp.]